MNSISLQQVKIKAKTNFGQSLVRLKTKRTLSIYFSFLQLQLPKFGLINLNITPLYCTHLRSGLIPSLAVQNYSM